MIGYHRQRQADRAWTRLSSTGRGWTRLRHTPAQPRKFHRMPRHTLAVLGLLPLLLLPSLCHPARPAAHSSPPVSHAARPSAGVQALLDRAAREPTEKALKTLDEAAKRADVSRDRTGGVAVAEL